MYFSQKGIILFVIVILAIGVIGGAFLFLRNQKSSETASIPPPPALPSAFDGGESATSGTATENQVIIRMTKDGFLPSTITAVSNDTIIFVNEDQKPRWPASNIHPTHQIYPEFDPLKPISSGESWSFVFDKPGRWRYHDHLFPELNGEINVAGTKEVSKEENTEEKKLVASVSPQKGGPPIKNEAASSEFLAQNIFEVAKSDEKIRFWMGEVGSVKLMEKLLADSGGGSTIDCHQESHNIGRMTYKIYGSSAFAEGDASCHSGFYHGAMEAFLAEQGTVDLAQNIEKVCNTFSTGFGKFECLHGVGHGIMAYEDYDLPKTIETCRKLGTEYERNSCYGGVFMENIIVGQGLGAIRDHGTKWVSKDPQFPCNSITQEYNIQFQCWQMQTSWILTLHNYSFDAVMNECLKAPPDMVQVCFKSLGRDAAGHTLRNPQKIVEICNKVPRESDYLGQCLIGAVNVIVDFWGAKVGNKASELCRMAPEPGKKACYSTLYGRLFDVFASASQRKSVCNTFEEEYKSYCSTL